MRFSFLFVFSFFLIWMCCCSTDKNTLAFNDLTASETTEMMQLPEATVASVTKAEISGDENAYTFTVTIASPDTGCEQYADWWEVVGLDGNLLYRRILAHSHVNEQPFSRSGGPVAISANTEVYVRAHMNNSGYASDVQKGSAADGFSAASLGVEFAQDLEEAAPLPDGCAF